MSLSLDAPYALCAVSLTGVIQFHEKKTVHCIRLHQEPAVRGAISNLVMRPEFAMHFPHYVLFHSEMQRKLMKAKSAV